MSTIPVTEGRSLRIEYDKKEDEIILTTIDFDRFTEHGFGTFLENVDPPEVSISQAALDALLACPERDGLQGLEFWADNRLAWGAPVPCLIVPCDEVNCPEGAKIWLRLCSIE